MCYLYGCKCDAYVVVMLCCLGSKRNIFYIRSTDLKNYFHIQLVESTDVEPAGMELTVSGLDVT